VGDESRPLISPRHETYFAFFNPTSGHSLLSPSGYELVSNEALWRCSSHINYTGTVCYV